ncbi:hypothetical protein P3T18_006212 [Paraburkholderia sp. GAS199]|uniref:hypothetical protein n=1 Tax=Paraburkholderia sp. GAS199 TaxID=3035126 RepID=UPI003D1F3E13
MPMELAYSGSPRALERADASEPPREAQWVPTSVVAMAAPEFVSSPLTRRFPHNLGVPRAGDLHLWRFRCEWLPVPVQEGDTWLSKGERERARLHPNAALRKRFVSARVVARWIVANLFGCQPSDVDLHDDGNEKLRARHPRDGRGLALDIAYGGIWIVIGVSATTLGLGVTVPAPGIAADLPALDGERRRARYMSLCNALRYAPNDIDPDLFNNDSAWCGYDLAQHGRWHLLDVPMAGKVRAAVALAQPVTRVYAIGWPKALSQHAWRGALADQASPAA